MASMLRSTSSLVSRPMMQRAAFRPAVAPVSRGSLQVVCKAAGAVGAAKLPKKMDSAVKRAMIAEERRMYNKARKSACATRVKKVIKAAELMLMANAAAVASEADLKPFETLIAEAYTTIDKAVSKGIIHKNNAARKKARCARYKKKIILKNNLWQPPADHKDYAKWAAMHMKTVSA
ncbi:hypothetical protein FOA52_004826 [Chlamydomonas sp. UWO 241]|nr:hypothetical protein FOA52_004826 [Chlamydomonas sp. UWO 241]